MSADKSMGLQPNCIYQDFILTKNTPTILSQKECNERRQSIVKGEEISNEFKSFGDFLTAKREKKDITLRKMSRFMGVSAPFLSDVKKD